MNEFIKRSVSVFTFVNRKSFAAPAFFKFLEIEPEGLPQIIIKYLHTVKEKEAHSFFVVLNIAKECA
jgi:hypothetical protein